MQIGIDFGTTNSGAAVFDGQQLWVFPLDNASHDPTLLRSTMYITRDHQIFIGREAIDTYYQQNIGRPSKIVRQRIGEITETLSDVGSVKGYPVGPQTIVRDVYALVDELTPGRLLHSLKSGLATNFEGNKIFGRFYGLEDLIAIFLQQVKERVEKLTGKKVSGAVLGRPVNFVDSQHETDNQHAEQRLEQAALAAGFESVTFQLEPVAAALHYELTANRPQNIVIFDLGGGTLDITVMRVGTPAERRVFATGGVGIAGDSFDRRIIEGLLLDHFGRGVVWGEDQNPFPSQYTQALLNWQSIPELIQPDTLNFLRHVQAHCQQARKIRALESLLVNNYVMQLYDQVEQAKIALSQTRFSAITLAGENIDLWQPITRSQFEALIAAETDQIESCLLDTLSRSGFTAADIDAVVRTGGSAQIPCFIELLERIFGPDKVVVSQVFSGVTAGLAIHAHSLTE